MKQITIIFLTIFISLLTIGISAGNVYEVYEGESIQAVINNATDNDTVFIHPGTYYEHLSIYDEVSLQGVEGQTFLIADDDRFVIIFINANNVDITGIDISGTRNIGIQIDTCFNVLISNCSIHHTERNIHVSDSDYIIIRYNDIHNAQGYGIYTIRSNALSIWFNKIYMNGFDEQYTYGHGGVLISMSNDTHARGNIIHSNYCQYGGFTYYSTDNSMISKNVMFNNTANASWAINKIDCDIYLRWSDNNLIFNNIAVNGVYEYASTSNLWNLPPSDGPNIAGGGNIGGNYYGNADIIDHYHGINFTPYHIPGSTETDKRTLISPIPGDVDMNGYISINDVIELYKKSVDPTYDFGHPYIWVANTDMDNSISINDVIELYKKSVNPEYPIYCVPMNIKIR